MRQKEGETVREVGRRVEPGEKDQIYNHGVSSLSCAIAKQSKGITLQAAFPIISPGVHLMVCWGATLLGKQ